MASGSTAMLRRACRTTPFSNLRVHVRPARSIFSNALNFRCSAIAAFVRSPCLCGATDEGENRMNDDDTPVVHEPSDNDMRTIVNLIAMAIICLTIFLIFAAIGPASPWGRPELF